MSSKIVGHRQRKKRTVVSSDLQNANRHHTSKIKQLESVNGHPFVSFTFGKSKGLAGDVLQDWRVEHLNTPCNGET